MKQGANSLATELIVDEGGTGSFVTAGTWYDRYTYTITKAGLYLITCVGAGTYNSRIAIRLMINGNQEIYTTSDASAGSPSTSFTTVKQLSVNDVLTLQATSTVATSSNDRVWNFTLLKIG